MQHGGELRGSSRGVSPELRLASTALLASLALLPPAAGVGFLADGPTGAVSVAAGVGIVAALWTVSLPLYRFGGGDFVRVAVLGIVLRLSLAAVLLLIAAGVPALSPPALAAGLAVALVTTQVAEMAVAGRDPRLHWVDPYAKRRTAA
jgi:hypothetical protein